MKSTWLSEVTLPPSRPPLLETITTEVVIVGGGLASAIAGYLLSKAGRKVVILEKKDISSTTTAHTTAWLNCVIDTDLTDLIKMYKQEGAQKIWRSGMGAIDLIENIIAEENIDCDFKRVSHYRYANSESQIENLKDEKEAAKKIGFDTVLHDKKSLAFDNFGSLELGSQAKFHPIKFLISLHSVMEKLGAIIYENTEAESITGNNQVEVKTAQGEVKAEYCIIATYKPFNNPRELFAHTGMYLSYVLEASIPHGILKEGLYEDEENPYHYFRIDSNNGAGSDRIILGGEDHRKEIPIPEDKNFRALELYLSKLFPNIKYNITRKWKGPILETIDGLPYIGSYSNKYPNRLVATGFSGNGMTYSAIAGQILADIILNKKNPYQALYMASRKTRPYNFFRKGLDFAGEFFGGAVKNFFK